MSAKKNMGTSKETISAIVLTRNEQEMIEGCLERLDWVDEILVVDSGSTDKTVALVQEQGARVVEADPSGSFADWRNLGRDQARGDWLLYIDADERVTDELKTEIEEIVGSHDRGVFFVKRKNLFLGREMVDDRMERLLHRDSFDQWEGELSEHPVYHASAGETEHYLVHLTHRNLESMLEKTKDWSMIEARLMYEAGHPPISWWRLPRVVLGETWRRFGREGYWRYGTAGGFAGAFLSMSVVVGSLWVWGCL